jgi:hypothetical protein
MHDAAVEALRAGEARRVARFVAVIAAANEKEVAGDMDGFAAGRFGLDGP